MAEERFAKSLASLKADREEQALRVAQEQTRLAQLDRMLESLETEALVIDQNLLPKRAEYRDLGVAEAAKRWLLEVGVPKHIPEIADALQARGVETRSKNFKNSVRATLAKNKEFVHHGTLREATWTVKRGK